MLFTVSVLNETFVCTPAMLAWQTMFVVSSVHVAVSLDVFLASLETLRNYKTSPYCWGHHLECDSEPVTNLSV